MLSKTELAIFLATLDKLEHPSLILTDKSKSTLLTPSLMDNSFGGKQKPIGSTFDQHRSTF